MRFGAVPPACVDSALSSSVVDQSAPASPAHVLSAPTSPLTTQPCTPINPPTTAASLPTDNAPLHLPHTRAWLERADATLRARDAARPRSNTAAGAADDNEEDDEEEGSEEQEDNKGKGRRTRAREEVPYAQLTRNQRLLRCVLRGVVDLVFDGAEDTAPEGSGAAAAAAGGGIGGGGGSVGAHSHSSSAWVGGAGTRSGADIPLSATSTSASATCSKTGAAGAAAALLPETLYLDRARLARLAAEAADARALAMFALLFRQLSGSGSGVGVGWGGGEGTSSASASALAQLKRELRDICPAALGACVVEDAAPVPAPAPAPVRVRGSGVPHVGIMCPHAHAHSRCSTGTPMPDAATRRQTRADLALQVARRAAEARLPSSSSSLSPNAMDTDTRPSTRPTTHSSTHPTHSSTPSTTTPPPTAALAQRWAATHMRPRAPLAALLHTRVREAVYAAVLVRALPPSGAPPSALGVPAHLAAGTGRVHGHVAPALGDVHMGDGSGAGVGVGGMGGMGGVGGMGGMGGMGGVGGMGGGEGRDRDALGIAPEIARLAERVARLAAVHLHTHLPLYEAGGVLLFSG